MGRIPQEAHASADYTAKHLPAFDQRMASSKSGHPESNQGPSDLCKLYSQMLYQLSFRLSISNLAYSEPGSPFPECREGLTDRLSNSVLLPGIEPRAGSEEGRRHNH